MEPSHSDRHDKNLSSAEYRARLLAKLNCLIAVLEVAIAKISRSMDLPGANGERLARIRGNLQNTLAICHRAKRTLEKGLAGEQDARFAVTPHRTPDTADDRTRSKRMTYRDYVEFSSIEEYRRFKEKPPIRSEEIEEIDLDELVRRLLED